MSEMISSAEYRLFCRVRDKDPELNHLEGEDLQIMHASLKSGLVKVDGNGDYYLPPKTFVLISRYEEQLEKENDEHAREDAEEAAADWRWRRDAHRSWLQFGLNLIFSVVGFAAGVFVEHYFAILELFFALIG